MKRLFTLIALFAVMLGAGAQTFYEWKDGKYTERSISDVDSITFSLPESNLIQVQANAVDLGLQSGTLWADRNVGADSPEDYGDYFAWGETEPKTTYDWSTYKWCNGSNVSMTKYCTKECYGYNGYADNKITLEPSDDAATANWGEKWCMPTCDQFSELISKCTLTWTTQNSVKGYKVTGPNGKSIFLPAAGYRYGSTLGDAGSNGYYWSSSLYEYSPNYAYYLRFNSVYHDLNEYYRFGGHTVRAVAR